MISEWLFVEKFCVVVRDLAGGHVTVTEFYQARVHVGTMNFMEEMEFTPQIMLHQVENGLKEKLLFLPTVWNS